MCFPDCARSWFIKSWIAASAPATSPASRALSAAVSLASSAVAIPSLSIAPAPQIEQVDPGAGEGLHPADVQIIEERHLDQTRERGLGAGIRVEVPVLEAEQPGQVDRVVLEAVRPGLQVEPAVPDVELDLDLGPDRELHPKLAQVDHLDAGVEVAGPVELEVERGVVARGEGRPRQDGVRDLDVRLDRRAGDFALHADEEADLDLPRDGSYRKRPLDARRDRHVHPDRPVAGELEIEARVELLVQRGERVEAQVRDVEIEAHVHATGERE